MPATPRAGFIDGCGARAAGIAGRGLEPATTAADENGGRTATDRDPDGHEIGFGDGPA